jgi:hypothetical protein
MRRVSAVSEQAVRLYGLCISLHRLTWELGVKLVRTASLARYVGTMLAAVLVASCAARAEPIFSFAATPGKLPKTVVPINYSIELRPDRH